MGCKNQLRTPLRATTPGPRSHPTARSTQATSSPNRNGLARKRYPLRRKIAQQRRVGIAGNQHRRQIRPDCWRTARTSSVPSIPGSMMSDTRTQGGPAGSPGRGSRSKAASAEFDSRNLPAGALQGALGQPAHRFLVLHQQEEPRRLRHNRRRSGGCIRRRGRGSIQSRQRQSRQPQSWQPQSWQPQSGQRQSGGRRPAKHPPAGRRRRPPSPRAVAART